MITPGYFGKTVAADTRRMDFDFGNEQLLYLKTKIDYLFIGDSITQLWDFHSYFPAGKTLVNRGIGGDTSEYSLKRFDADVIQLNPDIAVIMIGTNDISRIHGEPWWRKPGDSGDDVIKDVLFNITQMVEKCFINQIIPVLCSVPPSEIAPPFPREERKDITIEINEKLEQLCKEKKLLYVDYFSVLCKDDERTIKEEYTLDGIHPNAPAYAVMAEKLKTSLEMIGKKI